jgi:hypothetical protein
MGNASSNFIEPLLSILPAPKNDNVEGMIRTYAKVLNDFSDEALELAADTIIRTMKYKSMPLPGECIDACREATQVLELRRRRQQTKRKPIPKQVMWADADAKRADELFASHWGERAVNDGVEIALWDFLVQQKRWPNNNEYAALKATSLQRQAEFRGYLRVQEENGGLKPFANKWLLTMKAKSDKLKSFVEKPA